LKENGIGVVTDLSEIGVAQEGMERSMNDLPSALTAADEISHRAENRRIVFFLDYDGTLTPIVSRPEEAVLSAGMRETLRDLAEQFTVAVISGRDLSDVKKHVAIENIFYAGSHGFDIAGPKRRHIQVQKGRQYLPILDKAQKTLEKRLTNIPGAVVERKKFSIAAHYRNVKEGKEAAVEEFVDGVLADHPELRKSSGKKVYELQPKVDWHKGKALLWLLETLGLDRSDILPMYIGDDITDEDAFKALAGRGIGIVLHDRNEPRSTAAQYALEDPDEVRQFLRKVMKSVSSE
jgi:trehalose-phosphatase